MIRVSVQNLPDVIRLWCDDEWDDGIGDFEKIEKVLLKLKFESKKCILLYSNPDDVGNPDDPGEFPPMSSFIKIIAKLYFLRDLIRDTVKINIIHVKNEAAQSHLETLLKWYTPVNEIRIVKNKEEAMSLVKSCM